MNEKDIVVLTKKDSEGLYFGRTFCSVNDDYIKSTARAASDFMISDLNESELKANTDIFNAQTAKTYREFIQKIKFENKKRIGGKYLTVFNDDKIYLFKTKLSSARSYSLIVKYQPEKQELMDIMQKILRIDDKCNFKEFVSDKSNSFNYICAWQILETILAKYSLDVDKGEVPFRRVKLKDGKRKKVREVIVPHPSIRSALRDVNKILQGTYDKRNISQYKNGEISGEDIQVGGKRGKSVKSGALKHINHKFVFNLDIHHFYQSCKKEAVEKYLCFLFNSAYNKKLVEKEFFDIILIDDALFLGSPISGTIANAILSGAARYMNNFAKKFDMTLSVYVDDITFSSDKFINKDFVVSVVSEAFRKYGLEEMFTLSEEKCYGLSGCNRKVTGVAINDQDKITVPRKYYRNLRYELHALEHGEDVNVQKLRGKFAYALMIDDSGKIKRLLNNYRDCVLEYNIAKEEKFID